jgi:hypothetical protein
MIRVIKQWVDLDNWSEVVKMIEDGWEIANEIDSEVLLIKEI